MLAACLYLWDIMWGDESPCHKEAWQIKVVLIVAYRPYVCIVCQHTLPPRFCMFVYHTSGPCDRIWYQSTHHMPTCMYCLHTCIVTHYLGHPHRPGVRLARYLRPDQACMCVCMQSTDDGHVFEPHISMTSMYACMYIPRELMASGEGSLDDSERPVQTTFDDVARVGTLPSLPAGILCTVRTSIHCLTRLDISPRAL